MRVRDKDERQRQQQQQPIAAPRLADPSARAGGLRAQPPQRIHPTQQFNPNHQMGSRQPIPQIPQPEYRDPNSFGHPQPMNQPIPLYTHPNQGMGQPMQPPTGTPRHANQPPVQASLGTNLPPPQQARLIPRLNSINEVFCYIERPTMWGRPQRGHIRIRPITPETTVMHLRRRLNQAGCDIPTNRMEGFAYVGGGRLANHRVVGEIPVGEGLRVTNVVVRQGNQRGGWTL